MAYAYGQLFAEAHENLPSLCFIQDFGDWLNHGEEHENWCAFDDFVDANDAQEVELAELDLNGCLETVNSEHSSQ